MFWKIINSFLASVALALIACFAIAWVFSGCDASWANSSIVGKLFMFSWLMIMPAQITSMEARQGKFLLAPMAMVIAALVGLGLLGVLVHETAYNMKAPVPPVYQTLEYIVDRAALIAIGFCFVGILIRSRSSKVGLA